MRTDRDGVRIWIWLRHSFLYRIEIPQNLSYIASNFLSRKFNLASDGELGSAVAVGYHSLGHIGKNSQMQTVLLSAQVVRLSRLPTNVAGHHLSAFIRRTPLEFSRPADVVRAPSGRPVVLRTLPSCVCA